MTYDEARSAVILKRQALADWQEKEAELKEKAAFAATALRLHEGGDHGSYGSGREGKLTEEVRAAERKFAEVCLEMAQLPSPRGRRRR